MTSESDYATADGGIASPEFTESVVTVDPNSLDLSIATVSPIVTQPTA